MSNFLFNPGLLLAGAIAISVPILIHFFNKRRFRRVDWAPMEFLLKAYKINRRRLKLEDLILLLLRCLAVLLLGFLLARPFLNTNSGGVLFQSASYERVFLLDDSLSMEARLDGISAFDQAKRTLSQWVEQLATERQDDRISVLLASQPEVPLAAGIPLSPTATAELLTDLEAVTPSAREVDLAAAMMRVEALVKEGSNAEVNQIVYVLSDLRAKDWGDAGADSLGNLQRLAKASSGVYVVNFGAPRYLENLAVEKVVPLDKAIVAGGVGEFEVHVRNYGQELARDVPVRFGATGAVPVDATIDRIESGQSATARFVYQFASLEADGELPPPVALVASLGEGSGGALAGDDQYFFPGEVSSGIRVLLIDGDPGRIPRNSETFYLQKALAPKGTNKAGFDVTVVDESFLDDPDFAAFQVVALANVFKIPDLSAAAIKTWVAEGGALILTPGDQVDASVYNDLLLGDEGIMPVTLTGIAGDPKEENWANIVGIDSLFPMFQFFTGESEQLLAPIKIFQWWMTEFSEEASELRIAARLGSETGDPLILQSDYGAGVATMVTTSVDLDWGTWPQEAAPFVIGFQELFRDVTRASGTQGLLTAGEPVRLKIDIAKFQPEARLTLPGGESQSLVAVPLEGSSTEWMALSSPVQGIGFYRATLTLASDGSEREKIFVVNAPPREGDLRNVNLDQLTASFSGSEISLVAPSEPILGLSGAAARIEYWKPLLYLLIVILCVETWYAWRLGRKR